MNEWYIFLQVNVYLVAALRIYRQENTGRNYKVTFAQIRQYNKILHTINIYIYIGLQSWTKISGWVGVHDNETAYDKLWVDYRVKRINFRVDKNTQWAIYTHINHVYHFCICNFCYPVIWEFMWVVLGVQ